jgi:hypothetical protein
MRLRWLAYPACTAFLALGAACSSTDPGGLPTAQVRLLNGSTQSLTLDLVVGGEVVAQGVAMDQASGFGEAPSGSQAIVLRASGAGNPLSSVNATLGPGAHYQHGRPNPNGSLKFSPLAFLSQSRLADGSALCLSKQASQGPGAL